jgi:uncharacterized delta-60 repeat protein
MAVAIQPDGKIVLVARCFASAAMGIARLNSDGSPDATFGTDGFVDIVEGFAGPQVLVLPNGDIVVGGTGGTSPPDSRFSEGSLTRYLPDGSLDPTFGRDGVVHIRRPAFSIGRIAQGPDGTILASITEEFKRYPGHGGTTMGVARFTDRGNLDSSFGQAGVALGTFHSWTVGTGLAVQTDGGIVVAGYSLRDWTLSRFDPDGTPDITFSKDGSTGTSWARRCNPNTEYPRPGTPEGVAVQPNGKIVVVGLVIGSGSACDTNASAMLRFQPGGALDASFGTGGKVSTPGLDYGTDVRVLSTYRILVAGPGPDAHGNSALVLAQYLTS